MGWFWDTKPTQNPNDSTGDAYSKLDPSLRDFLDKQSPLTPSDTQPNPPSQHQTPPHSEPDQPYRAQLGLNTPGLNQDQQNAPPKDDRRTVPPESQFQDGRYAHLWKTYRPQSEIAAESLSDQDKLAAIYDSLSNRKAAIGRAALENCIEEQMAEKLCYSQGSIKQRMTMCRKENREFNRCFSMQSRFLKALGYLSDDHRSAEDEEKIQMHADRLYHEMLEREAAMDEARRLGQEKPVFQPLIHHDTTTAALGEDSAWARARRKAAEAAGVTQQTPGNSLYTNLSDFPPEKQKEIRDRLKNLSESEREVELQLQVAEARALQEYAEKVDRELREEKRHRDERRERGRETVGDSIKRLWGFGKG